MFDNILKVISVTNTFLKLLYKYECHFYLFPNTMFTSHFFFIKKIEIFFFHFQLWRKMQYPKWFIQTLICLQSAKKIHFFFLPFSSLFYFFFNVKVFVKKPKLEIPSLHYFIYKIFHCQRFYKNLSFLTNKVFKRMAESNSLANCLIFINF